MHKMAKQKKVESKTPDVQGPLKDLREGVLKKQEAHIAALKDMMSKETRLPNGGHEIGYRLKKTAEDALGKITFSIYNDKDGMRFFFGMGLDGCIVAKDESTAIIITMPDKKRMEVPMYKMKVIKQREMIRQEESPVTQQQQQPNRSKARAIKMSDVVKPKGPKKDFVPVYTEDKKDELLGVIIGKSGQKATRYLPFKTPLAQMNPGVLKMQITRIKNELLDGEFIVNSNLPKDLKEKKS